MNIPVSFGDILEKEVITNIPKIYQKLKQIYNNLQFKTEEELGVVYQNYLKFTYDKYSTVKTLLYKNEGKFLYDFYEHVYLDDNNSDLIETTNTELIFEKTSTRTRSAFTVAGQDLGMNVTYLGAGDIQLGKKESVVDTAKVLGSMFDGIEFRGFSQQVCEDLAKYAGVPVWNGLTDAWHPTQMIADYLTVKENFGKLEGIFP